MELGFSRRSPVICLKRKKRATRFELANSSLGSYCLTTWRRPHGLDKNSTLKFIFRNGITLQRFDFHPNKIILWKKFSVKLF